MIIEIVYPPIVKAVNLIKSRAFLPPISQWEKGKKKKKAYGGVHSGWQVYNLGFRSNDGWQSKYWGLNKMAWLQL